MDVRTTLPFVAAVLATSTALADDDTGDTQSWLHYIERRHAIALIEGGIIVLPTAPVSQNQKGGGIPILCGQANCPVGQGDATIQLGIHILYRPLRDWAFGANFFFDPRPTSDSTYSGIANLPRTHARSYFFIGGEARYIPLHARAVEGWVGAQAGVVIVADRFTTNAGIPVPAIFGDQEVSLASEGFFFGAQLGVDWYISDRIMVGLVTRYNHWILPEQPTCSPILDCTTLTGNVDSFDFGFTLGYRLSL
jgi:hypothetical protein